jgi:kinesin family protein C2/C3
MDMMARGARNRHSAETKMNARSSRSHQVLTVIVDGFNRLTGVRTHGCLHLIDLAGSERTSKSEATGE